MDMDDTQEDIEILSTVKIMLGNYDCRNAEYEKIQELVEQYIIKYCQHEIVKDYIDVSYEDCQCIYYCSKCLKTFDSDSIIENSNE